MFPDPLPSKLELRPKHSDTGSQATGRSACPLLLFGEITSEDVALGTTSEVKLSAATAKAAQSGEVPTLGVRPP